ncbi:acetyl-CoA carboxylase biotin carboxyl carrier protein subunit [Apilactobacillus micheneri]|uniref:Biotin carboxyl carrier protein of acetyl-CoA carboxylase n=1 Tax=Apilactobacillus micheneri TaxID=1899430 RepID=A0A9Q8INP9_9LACO|nr:acetyl-CoA carboxylase biotin carboxyl carrier protein subunit [Apilactobacillus micheneri]TPR41052.1 acetyl-CoA carboxylase biotin carboxyl carrier protein subunit [Apilactobacillus micheneri]TPR42632.1 acetyl-CoA carboxylase biotin carboxyl carrier protein subunit [Apilactobacillus micheneri]TPR45600.1 acetyl-CoA carboxylase biotin carboxyl carrier protein subunit [Apilactobacillus micheneri]TPR46159.1 acetyl-CoA carboxylase biotin carboxyl carrier protein subunit [Apilactobacillus michene
MDEKDIENLMDKFDKSSMKEFKVTGDDGTDIYFSKLEHAPVQNVAPAASSNAASTKNENASSNQAAQSIAAKIKAPLVGIVYFAPSPEKPVYKNVGDHVKKGETVCVIEAMKVINEVKSPISGTITKQVANDGDMVEYDQPIFEVEED